MPARQRSPAVRLAIGLAVFLATLAVLLAGLEGGLRLTLLGSLRAPEDGHTLQLFEPHPTRGWKLRPSNRAWLRTPDYSVLHTTNSSGWRDVEHALEKPAGVYRVVVLGDSFMEAAQVSLEESFGRVLEAELGRLAARPVEVVDLGCSGYGQVQELLTLREEGLAYDPDLVLLAFLLDNDLRNNHPGLEQEMGWYPGRPFARTGAEGELEIFTTGNTQGYMDMQDMANKKRREDSGRSPWKKSVLYSRWQRAFGAGPDPEAQPAADPNVWLGAYTRRFDASLFERGPNRAQLTESDYERMWSEARASLGPLFAAIRDAASEAGADFLVFSVPALAEVDPEYQELVRERFPTLELEFEDSGEQIAAAASAHGIALLDLLPAFRAARRDGGTRLHHAEDRHWNAAGHRLAAHEVAAHIVAQGYLE